LAEYNNAHVGDPNATPDTFTQEQLIEQINAAVTEATTGLKKKNDELLGEKKAAKDNAAEAETERQRISDEASKKSGDVEALEASWANKVKVLETSHSDKIAPLLSTIEKLTVGAAASDIAARIAIDPDASVNISDYLRSRLRLDMADGKTSIQVLDGEGKASATTLKELEAQVAELPRFKHVIKGNQASGGGAANASGGAVNSKKRSEMSAVEKRQYQEKHGQEAFLKLPK
jgi:hypothetical protein